MNRPVHFEILGDEPAGLAKFYGDLLGWEVASWDGPQQYWLAGTGPTGEPGIDGGFMHRHFDQPVILTMSVASLEETLAAVEAGGGSRLHGPTQLPDVGTHAYCRDPQGIIFGLLQPLDRS